jgi:hypothetical protein
MNAVTTMVPISRRRALGILLAALVVPSTPAWALEPKAPVSRLWKPIDPFKMNVR